MLALAWVLAAVERVGRLATYIVKVALSNVHFAAQAAEVLGLLLGAKVASDQDVLNLVGNLEWSEEKGHEEHAEDRKDAKEHSNADYWSESKSQARSTPQNAGKRGCAPQSGGAQELRGPLKRTKSSLNLAGSSAPRWGIWRSPMSKTN